VLDDDGGTIFDLLPPGAFPAQRRLFATPHGRDLAHLARCTGSATSASRSAGRGDGRGRLAPGPPDLVHVPVRPLDREVSARVRTVVADALGVSGDR
jgi:hypothetical protein